MIKIKRVALSMTLALPLAFLLSAATVYFLDAVIGGMLFTPAIVDQTIATFWWYLASRTIYYRLKNRNRARKADSE